MSLQVTPFSDLASKIVRIKKTESILPIAQKTAVINTLLVGDDLVLRTSLTSPVSYDREMIKLLHKHSVFVEKDETITPTLDAFSYNLSNIDKICLIWGLYKSSYDVLDKEREIECSSCKTKSKHHINMDDLIHEDTFNIWDKEVPFYEYNYIFDCEYENYVYRFHTKLPSIQDNNIMLNLISIDALQYNIEKTGSLFTKGQRMALITNNIELFEKSNPDSKVCTSSFQEILIAYDKYIPHQVAKEFFNNYSSHFDKYVPEFYYNVECPSCKNKFKHNVDLELEFFRKCILG